MIVEIWGWWIVVFFLVFDIIICVMVIIVILCNCCFMVVMVWLFVVFFIFFVGVFFFLVIGNLCFLCVCWWKQDQINEYIVEMSEYLYFGILCLNVFVWFGLIVQMNQRFGVLLFFGDNGVYLILDYQELFDEMVEVICMVQQYVYVEFYILQLDDFIDNFFCVLEEVLVCGVEVCVLFDYWVNRGKLCYWQMIV